MGWKTNLAVCLGTVGIFAGSNLFYSYEHESDFGLTLRRPTAIFTSGYYSSDNYPEAPESERKYVTESILFAEMKFYRDGGIGNEGKPDGFVDTYCFRNWFLKRKCLNRDEDYVGHEAEFNEADQDFIELEIEILSSR